jgi:hypothetical protein
MLSEERRTYSPGLPVHVEKLKKYSAKPIASPGASRDPENARSAFAMRVSKICFLICEGFAVMEGWRSFSDFSRYALTSAGVAAARCGDFS